MIFQLRDTDHQVGEKLAEVYAKLSDIEADKAPARAAVILHGLGFTTAMQVRQIHRNLTY